MLHNNTILFKAFEICYKFVEQQSIKASQVCALQ